MNCHKRVEDDRPSRHLCPTGVRKTLVRERRNLSALSEFLAPAAHSRGGTRATASLHGIFTRSGVQLFNGYPSMRRVRVHPNEIPAGEHMAARERWETALKCPKCGREGAAKWSEED